MTKHLNKSEMKKEFINVDKKMKNAFEYTDGNPASFSRGVVVSGQTKTLYVSGTASIGSNGETLHKGDFDHQTRQTFVNLTHVLNEAYFEWKDVIRLTIYLRDIDRDYAEFNKIRKKLFGDYGIVNLPASTCIGAKICRSDLLVEIELIAMK